MYLLGKRFLLHYTSSIIVPEHRGSSMTAPPYLGLEEAQDEKASRPFRVLGHHRVDDG